MQLGGVNIETSLTALSSSFVTKIKINAGGTMDLGPGYFMDTNLVIIQQMFV